MARKGQRLLPRNPPPGDPDDPRSFLFFLPRYLEKLALRGYSPATAQSRRYHLEAFFHWTAERGLLRPADITRPILERYQRWLFYLRKPDGKPLSFQTQTQRLVAVRGFFRWLARQNFILYNPASELEAPRHPKRLPRFVLTAPEVEQVLALPDLEQPFGLRDRAILETFYSTGMRRSELVHLKLSDIDAERGTVFIRQGKGGKDRVVPIGERALAWLERYLLEVRPAIAVEPDEGHVFLSYLVQLPGSSRTDLLKGGAWRAGEFLVCARKRASARRTGNRELRTPHRSTPLPVLCSLLIA